MDNILAKKTQKTQPLQGGTDGRRRLPGWLKSLWTKDRLSLYCLLCGLTAITLLLPGFEAGNWIALGTGIAGTAIGIRAVKTDGWNLTNKFGLLLSAASLTVMAIALAIVGNIVAQLAGM